MMHYPLFSAPVRGSFRETLWTVWPLTFGVRDQIAPLSTAPERVSRNAKRDEHRTKQRVARVRRDCAKHDIHRDEHEQSGKRRISRHSKGHRFSALLCVASS